MVQIALPTRCAGSSLETRFQQQTLQRGLFIYNRQNPLTRSNDAWTITPTHCLSCTVNVRHQSKRLGGIAFYNRFSHTTFSDDLQIAMLTRYWGCSIKAKSASCFRWTALISQLSKSFNAFYSRFNCNEYSARSDSLETGPHLQTQGAILDVRKKLYATFKIIAIRNICSLLYIVKRDSLCREI